MTIETSVKEITYNNKKNQMIKPTKIMEINRLDDTFKENGV